MFLGGLHFLWGGGHLWVRRAHGLEGADQHSEFDSLALVVALEDIDSVDGLAVDLVLELEHGLVVRDDLLRVAKGAEFGGRSVIRCCGRCFISAEGASRGKQGRILSPRDPLGRTGPQR